jgi:hypothetical protein
MRSDSVKFSVELEMAAQTHFFLRPKLVMALEQFVIAEDQRHVVQGAKTYAEYFQVSFSDRFFDSATMMRLGTAIERHLKARYQAISGGNIAAIRKGAFQRIQPNHTKPDDAQHLFNAIGINLPALADFRAAQEVMLHRHLYAHSSGLLDDSYVKSWRKLTGEDILKRPGCSRFLLEETYVFQPLQHLPEYIEALRRLFRELG